MTFKYINNKFYMKILYEIKINRQNNLIKAMNY